MSSTPELSAVRQVRLKVACTSVHVHCCSSCQHKNRECMSWKVHSLPHCLQCAMLTAVRPCPCCISCLHCNVRCPHPAQVPCMSKQAARYSAQAPLHDAHTTCAPRSPPSRSHGRCRRRRLRGRSPPRARPRTPHGRRGAVPYVKPWPRPRARRGRPVRLPCRARPRPRLQRRRLAGRKRKR